VEGGNYECVNKPPFLEKVLDIASNRFSMLIDHSDTLYNLKKYNFRGRELSYIETIANRYIEFPINPIKKFGFLNNDISSRAN
jgi:hypothetical protein